jgi:hypothetical protein
MKKDENRWPQILLGLYPSYWLTSSGCLIISVVYLMIWRSEIGYRNKISRDPNCGELGGQSSDCAFILHIMHNLC